MSDEDRSAFLRQLVDAAGGVNPRSLIGIAVRRSGVSDSGDLLRILSLPRRTLDVAKTPDLTPLFRREGSTKQLWPIQSAMLLECEAAQGLVGAVSVGGGKALTSFLLPYAVKSKRTVLFVPAPRKQKTLHLLEQWDKDFKIPRDVIKVYSYHDLQGEKLARLLYDERPDFLILDEAQGARHKDTNRGRRLRAYMHEFPETKMAVLTGTLSKKSVKDYFHLVAWALKERSPVPLEWRAQEEWAEALDPSDDPLPAGALNKLCKEHSHADHFGRYRCRISSSYGFLSPNESAFTGSIAVERRACSVPGEVSTALKRLQETWEVSGAPEDSSEEVRDVLEYARLARSMAFGLYLRWDWGSRGRDEEWLAARSEWNRTIRHLLRYGRNPDLDSPSRIIASARNRSLGPQYLAAWDRWCEVKVRPAPPSVPRWISKFIVDDIKGRIERGTVVWCESIALRKALAETLGVPDFESEEQLKPYADGRPLVLSKNVFGTGLDLLQWHYHINIYTFVPNAQDFEQLTGRTAREGQTKKVLVEVPTHTAELEKAFEETIKVARRLEEREGQAQLLLMGIGK